MGKNTWKVPRTISPWKSLLKRDVSEVWKATKVAIIHHLKKQYTTKQVEPNLPSWCSGAVSWIDLHYRKIHLVGLLLTLRLPF